MALEAVVYPQDFFGYSGRDMYNLLGGNWSCEFGVEEREEEKVVPFDNFLENQTENCYYDANWSATHPSMVPHLDHLSHMGSMVISEEFPQLDASASASGSPTVSAPARIRRRSKSRKNQEEIENQRMTHIAVERNRRKQMNQYLSVLRSLMPDSYVPRGDQASIIGGAINYVKELEQRLQCLVGHKHMNQNFETSSSSSSTPPFADFFTFPQYSTAGTCENPVNVNDLTAENRSSIADIEVTMVETHANLKIRSKRRPKQLLKVVSGLQSLRLTVLHLNVTTVDQIVLYSFSVKVEDDCKLISVGEIATAVNEMLGRIQEEAHLI